MPSNLTRLYQHATSGVRFRIKARKLAAQATRSGNGSWWLAPHNAEMSDIIGAICDPHDKLSLNPFALTRGANDARKTEAFLRSVIRPDMRGLSVGYRDKTLLGVDFSSIFNAVRYCETGFIANRFDRSDKQFISYLVDKQRPYFDGREKTDLEDQLNSVRSGWWHSDSDVTAFLDEFRSSDIQKYSQSPNTASTTTSPTDLLVIGQYTGDQSLVFTDGEVRTNVDLVRSAMRDYASNFGRVLFRAHPKNPTIEADRCLIEKEFGPKITVLDTAEPFSHLLKGRPTVATMSSGGGLEAAVKGCPVISYCVSFYSNWGFTIDRTPCARRTAKLTVEDVFLHVYTRYSKYLDPFGPGHISALEALRA